MSELARDLRELELELHGGPGIRGVRPRLHDLENDSIAAKAAKEAIDLAKRKDAEATAERQLRFSWRWRALGIIVGLEAAIMPPLTIYLALRR